MKSMTLGYARVSTDEQNLDRQIDALNKYGVDIIFNRLSRKEFGVKVGFEQP